MYALEVRLEYERHRIEKKRDIEDGIPHREDLPCHRHRDEVTESDRRSGDHREVESIEVALSDRISSFEIVDEKCPDDPAHDEYDPDDDELAVVDMEHICRYEYSQDYMDRKREININLTCHRIYKLSEYIHTVHMSYWIENVSIFSSEKFDKIICSRNISR